MDGKGNTQRIVDAGVTIATVINGYNDGTHGSTEWYLPSCGQLYNIYTNKSQINTLLEKVSGTAMSTSGYYWSSSVYSAINAWRVFFYRGSVLENLVKETSRVRLVRDL